MYGWSFASSGSEVVYQPSCATEVFDPGLRNGIRVAVRYRALTRWVTSKEVETGCHHCRLRGVFHLAYLGRRVAKEGQDGSSGLMVNN